jgi:hypothetical protein
MFNRKKEHIQSFSREENAVGLLRKVASTNRTYGQLCLPHLGVGGARVHVRLHHQSAVNAVILRDHPLLV